MECLKCGKYFKETNRQPQKKFCSPNCRGTYNNKTFKERLRINSQLSGNIFREMAAKQKWTI